ncbi:MAG: hypothetical protein IJ251_03110 [Oscillospiraceae bacterium]|nr:hypothetical protein [Oscillospiraceae bacterium]
MDDLVLRLTDEIRSLCDPYYIYMVSSKHNNSGEVTSMKLCVVVGDDVSSDGTERTLLVKTDTPIPVDFIVYNISDWNDYAEEDNTFAYRVENGGEKLYVKE